MIILVVFVTIALTIVLICLLRYFTIERTPEQAQEPLGAGTQMEDQLPPSTEEPPLVNLVDYFGNAEKPPEAPEGLPEAPPSAQAVTATEQLASTPEVCVTPPDVPPPAEPAPEEPAAPPELPAQPDSPPEATSEPEEPPEKTGEPTAQTPTDEPETGGVHAADTTDTFDPLSELKTGRAFLLDCQKRLNEFRAEGMPCAVVYFDFDRFRFINNLKGYAIGDYCLTNMGRAMQEVFPDGALCTRLSGDHFAALFALPEAVDFAEYADQLARTCERIRTDIGIKSGLRICMGYVVAKNERDYDMTVLLTKANIARHCIKVSKYETVDAFSDAMLTSYLYGESAVENYNEYQYDDDFVLYYQGIQDVNKKRMVSCEALARWVCEDDVNRGAVPISSDRGKLPTNNCKVVYQTCRIMSRWRKMGKELLPVFVNLPATDLFKEDIDALFVKCMTEFQLDPSMLGVILHAGTVRTDWTITSRQIKKLKELGLQVGVDGIDTGYADIDFLSGLQIDFIKLHRSFLHNIATSGEHEEPVRRMLALAAGFNLRVIFEGVDYFEPMQKLIDLGVREVQGKAVGIPEPPEEFGRTLPEYVEKKRAESETVILDDYVLSQGEYHLF